MKNKIEEYLSDLDNLLDTKHFHDRDISEWVFYHKGMTLEDFIHVGRELMRQLIHGETLNIKDANNTTKSNKTS
jgi:hypothetical protein